MMLALKVLMYWTVAGAIVAWVFGGVARYGRGGEDHEAQDYLTRNHQQYRPGHPQYISWADAPRKLVG